MQTPKNHEVELITKKKQVNTAEENLNQVRQYYKDVMKSISERWRAVYAGQRGLQQNLVKFNNFVKY